MEENKKIEDELIQLRDALTQVKENTEKYSKQSQKSPTLLANLTKSLHQLQALNPSSKAK